MGQKKKAVEGSQSSSRNPVHKPDHIRKRSKNTNRKKYCGKGTVPIDGTCVPAELGFQMIQSISKNPINSYAEIQGMLASKTIFDNKNAGPIATYVQSGALETSIVQRKTPNSHEWLWSKN